MLHLPMDTRDFDLDDLFVHTYLESRNIFIHVHVPSRILITPSRKQKYIRTLQKPEIYQKAEIYSYLLIVPFSETLHDCRVTVTLKVTAVCNGTLLHLDSVLVDLQ